MSYVMDFEERSNLRPDDSIIEYEGFNMGTDLLLMLLIQGFERCFDACKLQLNVSKSGGLFSPFNATRS